MNDTHLQPQPSYHTPIRVLIADDSAYVRRSLQSFLGRYPQVDIVAAAENYYEMVDAVKRLHPDVVLLDLHMPGEEMFNATFVQHDLAGIPAICMSIWSDEETMSLTREYGCQVIDKSTLDTALVPAIELAAHRHASLPS